MEQYEKVYIGMKAFLDAVHKLEWAIKQSGEEYTAVYGVPRGGLPLAVWLSHRLSIPLGTNPENITDNYLVADDISDTGETLNQLCESVGANPDTACIHTTPWTSHPPTYHAYVKRNGQWIVYCWEFES